MSEQLTKYSLIRTAEPDEMQSILLDRYGALSFDYRSKTNYFEGIANLSKLDSTSLSFCSYGTPVSLAFGDEDYFRLQFCLAGSAATTSEKMRTELRGDRAVVSRAEGVFEFGPSFEQLVLRAERASLEQDLANLLGAKPQQPLRFDPIVDLHSAEGQNLRRLVFSTASTIDAAERDTLPAPLLLEFDRLLRLAILLYCPNNFSDRLTRTAKEPAPWQVRRIEEWIDANWRRGVTIDALAAVSGTSGRSIFAAFKRSRGYTPMAYAKTVRLKASRDMLQRPAPDTSVTGVAFACNFSNLGHFSKDYQQMFGELPSATLSKSKARLG